MPEPLSAERLGKLLDEATEELRMRRAEIDRLRAEVEALRKGPSVGRMTTIMREVNAQIRMEGYPRLHVEKMNDEVCELYARTILRALGRDVTA